jgi:8-oxo-dGTP pyrophosphatase MutT (NUDIX family)/ubiquinone/menaquinone biosynthesis C-methylase UbiE
MKITGLDLSGKTILEIGSGRGGTTRVLARQLAQAGGGKLIATDLSTAHFDELRRELGDLAEPGVEPVSIEFIQTPAEALEGIPDGSIDLVACAYTLCALASRPGRAALALERIRQVLKTDGLLMIEEEFPLERAASPLQALWAEKWRLLRAAQTAVQPGAGETPYREFDPADLSELCRLAGFDPIEPQAAASLVPPDEFLPFFEARLERLLPGLANDELQRGFTAWAARLAEAVRQAGGIEIPSYRLTARKKWVHPRHIAAASGLVSHPDGRVLMVRHFERGWEFPGGQVEEGESLPQALEREILEETGVRVSIGPLAGVYSNLKPPPKLLFGFICQMVSGELTTSLESPETAWVRRSEALERVSHPAIRDRIRDMLEFDGRVVYRVYTTGPYRVLEERRF